MELLSRIINHCCFSKVHIFVIRREVNEIFTIKLSKQDELLPHIDGNYTWRHIIFFATFILEALMKTYDKYFIWYFLFFE